LSHIRSGRGQVGIPTDALVLAGGLLAHGHDEFLFFIPLLALVALVPQRRQRRAHAREVLITAVTLATLFPCRYALRPGGC
jgi:hypothetical protein